jgi:hypothetical protein
LREEGEIWVSQTRMREAEDRHIEYFKFIKDSNPSSLPAAINWSFSSSSSSHGEKGGGGGDDKNSSSSSFQVLPVRLEEKKGGDGGEEDMQLIAGDYKCYNPCQDVFGSGREAKYFACHLESGLDQAQVKPRT